MRRRSSIHSRNLSSVSSVSVLTTTWRDMPPAGASLTVRITVRSPSPWKLAQGSAFVSSGVPLTASTYSPALTFTPGSSSGDRASTSHGPPRTIRLMRHASLASSQSTPSMPTERDCARSSSPPPRYVCDAFSSAMNSPSTKLTSQRVTASFSSFP